MSLYMTASQTVGPFFRIGLSALYRTDLTIGLPSNSYERLRVRGHVYDGDGLGIPDALLELWQADAQGQYANTQLGDATAQSERFVGFGRVPTDAHGNFEFVTIEPGRVPSPAGELQAPHISVHVLMRGLLKPAHTRLYFPDQCLGEDPLLQALPEARRATLIARSSVPHLLEWDIHMQGEHETVFFSY